jgi:predicted nucleic acid-binding protein
MSAFALVPAVPVAPGAATRALSVAPPHGLAACRRPLPDTRGRPPRVVLDTAVVVSALLFGGGLGARLRQAWQVGLCRPLACKATALDLGVQLAHPRLGLSAREQQQLLGDYLPYVLKVRVPQADEPQARDAPAALTDVRLAMAGRAHALVSGDATLLGAPARFAFAVLTLDDFLETLAQRDITPIPKPL